MKTNRFGRALLCGAAALCFLGGVSGPAALPTAHASMPAWNVTQETIEALQGTWYDLDGNVAFVVDGDTFNGRRIVHAMNFSGSGACLADFFLEGENIGERGGRFVSWMPNGRFLILDGKVCRNTKEPEYFESVRGVYLGMKVEDMLAILGEPERIINKWRFVWPDMTVNTNDGIVLAICLPKGGARLDGSGLGADSGEEEYREAYGFEGELRSSEPREIGSLHEKLSFGKYPEEVVLCFFKP